MLIWLTREGQEACCPGRRARDVIRRGTETREFKPPSIANRPVVALADVPRWPCDACDAVRQAEAAFAAPGRHGPRSFIKCFVAWRKQLTIRDLADHLGVSERLVRSSANERRQQRFSKPRRRPARPMAIDELSLGGGRKFVTVALALECGTSLFVGDGQGADALTPFRKRLNASPATVRAVAIDMSAAYIVAVQNHPPRATLAFDRCHVVKFFNDQFSDLRRELCREAQDQLHQDVLKGPRWLPLNSNSPLSK